MDGRWSGLGLLSLIVGGASLWIGGSMAHATAPLALAVLLLTCAVHRPSRELVLAAALGALSKSPLMAVATVVLAVFLVEYLSVEAAFFMAGEILLYFDALLAVSLVAAAARGTAAVVVVRDVAVRAFARRPRRSRAGFARARRALRRPTPAADEDAPWAFVPMLAA